VTDSAAQPALHPSRLRSVAATVSAWLLAASWLLELAYLVLPSSWLQWCAITCFCLFTPLAVMRSSAHVRWLFMTVVGVAAALAFWQGAPGILFDGMQHALVFGAFLASVILLRATVERSATIERLRMGFRGLGEAERVNWTFYGSHALGSILNVGAMAVLAPVLPADAAPETRLAVAASSVRGVGTAVMWSPFFVSMGFVCHLIPSVPMTHAVANGAGLALIGFVLCHGLFARSLGLRGTYLSVRRLAPLVVPTLSIVAVILAVTGLTSLTGTQAVVIVVPVICILHVLASQTNAARTVARDTLAGFSRLADEIVIIIGAIVLGSAISSMPFIATLNLGAMPALLSGPLLIGGLIALVVLLGIAGLHPMIGASVLAPIMAGGAFGVSDVVLVNTFVFAWGLSATVAVWTLPVAAAATIFKVPVTALGRGANVRFAAIYGVCAVAYLALMNRWLLA
jgi:hypothetical protein